MNNTHDEIKKLLKASKSLLGNKKLNEDVLNIKSKYGIITEDDVESDNITKKYDIGQAIEDEIEDDEYETAEKVDDESESKDDKKQAYRISGGVLVLHGKEQTDLELTTDEKISFQETMEEFVEEVSDMVDFNKLNVYPKNVEWSGKIIDFDIDFFFSIGEENGIYINGNMIKTDDKFIEMVNKLKTYYEKFKSKWAKVLASRKKTIKD
jgi:hypothetical protein